MASRWRRPWRRRWRAKRWALSTPITSKLWRWMRTLWRSLIGLLTAIALLAGLAVPGLAMRTGFSGIESLPERAGARQGFQLLRSARDAQNLRALGHQVAVVRDVKVGSYEASATEVGDPHARFLPQIRDCVAHIAEHVHHDLKQGLFRWCSAATSIPASPMAAISTR